MVTPKAAPVASAPAASAVTKTVTVNGSKAMPAEKTIPLLKQTRCSSTKGLI